MARTAAASTVKRKKAATRTIPARDAMRARAVMRHHYLPALLIDSGYGVSSPDPGDLDLSPFMETGANGASVPQRIADAARSVCRIDMIAHDGTAAHAGTGILIAPDIAMTCRHVIAVAGGVYGDGESGKYWTIGASPVLQAVFDPQPGTGSPRRKILSVLYCDDDPGSRLNLRKQEIALIALEPDGGQPAPVLPIHNSTDGIPHDAAIAVIGFPGPDALGVKAADSAMAAQGNETPVSAMVMRVFGDDAALQQGHMRAGIGRLIDVSRTAAARSYYSHNAPTMPGMSGGAVVDLASGKLIGLHCGGQHFIANSFQFFAQLLRFLKDDHPCRKALTPFIQAP